MRIVVSNSIGRLSNGNHVVLFPSRWDWAGCSHPFSYYPYELAYLSALLKRDTKHDVKMADPNHDQLNHMQASFFLLQLEPEMLITECSALTYPEMTKVMKKLKRQGMKTAWLTGPYGMVNEAGARKDGWDEVFHGEYESDVLQVALDYPGRDDSGNYRGALSGVDPAWTRSKNLVDLDWLPWPEDDDIARINYSEISNPFPGMVQLYPTRGCPMGCTFCVVPMYYGGHGRSFGSHRTRNPDNVCDEIQYLSGKYGRAFSGCFFNDETHNANPKWLESFANKLIERGLNQFHYDAMCGYWLFTEDMVKLLAKAGYCYLRIGIESMSRDVGKRIHKIIIPEKLLDFMRWCKEAGILVYGTSQIGAPGSTYDTDLQTLQQLWKLKKEGYLHRWQHSVSVPQPGTPFYKEVKDKGYLITEDLDKFNGVEPVISWPNYNAEQIAEMKEIYMCNAPA